MDGSQPLDPRKTIFVGGVPRPLRAGIGSHDIPVFFFFCSLNSASKQQHMTKLLKHVFRFSSGVGYDHGSSVRWRVLRRDRYWPRAEVPKRGGSSGFLQSAELYCCHQRPICSTAAWRHWQTGTVPPLLLDRFKQKADFCCLNYLNIDKDLFLFVNLIIIHQWVDAKRKCLWRRWRWSHTSSMTSSVTSVRAPAVAVSSLRSSAPTSHAYSTTASSAGPTSIPAPAASSTSLWSRKELTGHGRSTSAGTEREVKQIGMWAISMKHLTVYKVLLIYFSSVAAGNTTVLVSCHQITSASTSQAFCGALVVLLGFYFQIIFICRSRECLYACLLLYSL